MLLEQDDVGLAVASKRGERLGFLDIVYVGTGAHAAPGSRRELVREAATALRDAGAEMLELEVLQSNERARAVYERLGFLAGRVGARRADRRARAPARRAAEGATFGSVHVQTDDVARSSGRCRRYCRGSGGRSGTR